MGLMIKGMKLPEYRDVFRDKRGCVYLLMLTVNKDGTAYLQFNDVEGGFYQVKELPTPHGKLIDVTTLKNKIESGYCNKCTAVEECGVCVCQNCGIGNLFDDIDDTPAIVEAEEKENES